MSKADADERDELLHRMAEMDDEFDARCRYARRAINQPEKGPTNGQ